MKLKFNNGSTFVGCLLALVAISTTGRAQVISAPPEKQAVRQRIGEIVQHTVKAAHFRLRDGTNVFVRPLPSNEDIATVKSFGDTGIAVLSEYIKSKEILELRVVVRLLGSIESEAAKDAMDDFAENAELPGIRASALDFVAASGRAKDIALLKKVAAGDSDPRVKAAALDLIQRHRVQ
ncbi:MAG: HEAT repeat domain-containing protein [Candidatus Angelobacter sp.]